MSDETTIEPALSAQEWAEIRRDNPIVVQCSAGFANVGTDPRGLDIDTTDAWGSLTIPAPVAIALANDALPGDSPLKITHDRLFCLHEVLANFRAYASTQGDHGAMLIAQYAPDVEQLETALLSYLPPPEEA